jgi:hypothetical protein
MRVLYPGWTLWPSWLDVFPNIRLMPSIEAPVLIMHVRSSSLSLPGMHCMHV